MRLTMPPLPALHSRSFPLPGKVVVVSGGAAGIGRALCQELHARGAHVVSIDLVEDPDPVEHALCLVADVRDRNAMQTAIDRAVTRFGQVDAVVANAGVTPLPATLRTMDPADFDRVIGINLTGAFNTIRPALDHVVRNHGHVTVVASCAAFAPGAGGAAYMISKAAAEQLGRALRLELAPHGASATTAYFGVVETQLTRATLDDDPVGRQLARRLPPPLRTRISVERAAIVLADGIERRAASTVAPSAWQGWALARGIANPLLDGLLARDSGIHALLRELEERT